jgi:hypothetical protein
MLQILKHQFRQNVQMRIKGNNNENCCNFLSSDDWQRIPEDICKTLYSKPNVNVSNNNNNATRKINNLVHDDRKDDDVNNMRTDFAHQQVNIDSDSTALIDFSIIQIKYVRVQDLINIYNSNKGITKLNTDSTNGKKSSNKNDDIININGTNYRRCNFVSVSYRVNTNITSDVGGFSLVDQGANGGLLEDDILVLHQTNRRLTITGIDNHQVGELPIGTGAGYGMTGKGPVIFIMHQYACLGHGKAIHASGQLESFKLIVDNRLRNIGGKQRITTPDGYFIPLNIVHGLAYFKLCAPTDD